MNIELRPSGGRGEYELAGRQGTISVSDLYDLPMFVEILPGISINAYSKCKQMDGKPRIRLTSSSRNAHPSSLIAAAMMLPKPRREKIKTHGTNLVQWGQFVIRTIRIDVVPRADSVLLCPLSLRLENGDGGSLDLSFAERMARVVRIWTAAATPSGVIADAVRSHALAFTSATATQRQLVESFNALHSSLNDTQDDMVPLLERHFNLGSSSGLSAEDISAEIIENDFDENVNVDPTSARINRVRIWRLASVRGGSATAFRQNVRSAYNWRCMWSGQHLPRTDATTTAGVDAAHILPWSRYDLDATSNGLCLNKQCHWAFDEGFLRMVFDETENTYVVSIPPPMRKAAASASFDIGPFEKFIGPVSRQRLPQNEALWPSRQYLQELGRILDGYAA